MRQLLIFPHLMRLKLYECRIFLYDIFDSVLLGKLIKFIFNWMTILVPRLCPSVFLWNIHHFHHFLHISRHPLLPCTGIHLDGVRNHENTVKTDPKFTDQGLVLFTVAFELLKIPWIRNGLSYRGFMSSSSVILIQNLNDQLLGRVICIIDLKVQVFVQYIFLS